MAVFKLLLSDFDAIDYDLIAIHTTLEDYRLAFFINQKFPVLLSKSKDFLEFQTLNGLAFFSKFNYLQEDTEEEWTLIENKDELASERKSGTIDLFSNENEEIISNVYFLPDMKKVNYFLKIVNTTVQLDEILLHLNEITQISTAYIVDVNKLKSKNNLIF